MMGHKEIPNRADLIDYNYAVAGHAGTLCDADGELFIKPCTQSEIDFYESANEQHPAFADYMPLFMGTLLLNDATDITSINEQLPVVADHISPEMKEGVLKLAQQVDTSSAQKDNVKWVPSKGKKITTDKAVVLENAAYGYRRPNILDVKLGVRLWADDAPLEKKQRFDKISGETTHGDLGFRIAGMRAYRGAEDPAELDKEEYKIYDKDYGRVHVNTSNVVDAFRKFIFNPAARVDEELGQAVAAAFCEELKRVQEILEAEESRMYSSSLLFVFEGDGAALRGAIDETSASATAKSPKVLAEKIEEHAASGRSNARVDSGIDVDEHGELIMPVDAEDDEEEEEEANQPKIFSLKLIDFAHAAWVPGQGPDENVLKGVRSLVRIFDELSR